MALDRIEIDKRNREGNEKPPIKRFEQVSVFELYDLEDLSEDERLAAMDAMAAYKKSDNPEFRAGVSVVAEDGTRVSRHNEVAGQEGHAEMIALASLYRAVSPSQKKLRILALAATEPNAELIRRSEKYGPDASLTDIDVERPCGRCLKFISDYTGNFISKETGTNDADSDVTILLVTATGQILRTSLRSLHPMPHRPRNIPLKPLEQNITKSPDRYSTGGSNGK